MIGRSVNSSLFPGPYGPCRALPGPAGRYARHARPPDLASAKLTPGRAGAATDLDGHVCADSWRRQVGWYWHLVEAELRRHGQTRWSCAGQRSTCSRRQTDAALLELAVSRDAIQAALSSGQVSTADRPFVEDILARIQRALTPYFD
jgi:hypothetical protein